MLPLWRVPTNPIPQFINSRRTSLLKPPSESLLSSDEYQSLQKKGFFITSIIWRSKQTSIPYPIIEFEAAFEDPEVGKGFKYSVRGALNFAEGEYTKTLRPIEHELKQEFLSLIERTAYSAIMQIRDEAGTEVATTKSIKGD
jgi:hypothetical protein